MCSVTENKLDGRDQDDILILSVREVSVQEKKVLARGDAIGVVDPCIELRNLNKTTCQTHARTRDGNRK